MMGGRIEEHFVALLGLTLGSTPADVDRMKRAFPGVLLFELAGGETTAGTSKRGWSGRWNDRWKNRRVVRRTVGVMVGGTVGSTVEHRARFLHPVSVSRAAQ